MRSGFQRLLKINDRFVIVREEFGYPVFIVDERVMVYGEGHNGVNERRSCFGHGYFEKELFEEISAVVSKGVVVVR